MYVCVYAQCFCFLKFAWVVLYSVAFGTGAFGFLEHVSPGTCLQILRQCCDEELFRMLSLVLCVKAFSASSTLP